MEPNIVELEPRTLIGVNMAMSLLNNKTAELWRSFMPRRGEVANRTTSDYVSMQVYPPGTKSISPHLEFVKWASVEVELGTQPPEGMTSYELAGGLYAVFEHHGPASDGPKTMQFIFGQWLPTSGYELDQREHFERLPEDYNPMDPDAREQFWIPVKPKS